MYIYIFFSNFEILPFDFLFAKYSPDISKEKSISISSTFQLTSPTFSSKISRFSFETRKHFHWISSFKPVNTCSLSLFLPPRFCPRNDARTVTYMPIRYPSRMYRDTIHISRITQIAYVLAAYRSSSPLHSKTSNVATKRKRIIILIIILSLHISSEWE